MFARVVYYIKMQTRDVHGQKKPKSANIICESSLKVKTSQPDQHYDHDVSKS